MTKKDDINFDYNEEVKKCKTIDDVIGKDGLVQRLIKDVLENILEVEMGEHLGRDKYDRQTDIDQDGLMSIFWTQKVKLFYAALLANNSH
jgi:putative transposase